VKNHLKITSISIAFLVGSCVYEQTNPEVVKPNPAACESTNIRYTEVANILDLHCNNCHSTNAANGGIILDTYAEVKPLADGGILWCVVNHEAGCYEMPENGQKLDACTLSKIENWINQGAKND
jgi:uncharacterized membrane protein